MNDQISINCIVYDRMTDRMMYVDAYPKINGEWTGEYVCRWYDDDGYARRGTFKPDQIVTKDRNE